MPTAINIDRTRPRDAAPPRRCTHQHLAAMSEPTHSTTATRALPFETLQEVDVASVTMVPPSAADKLRKKLAKRRATRTAVAVVATFVVIVPIIALLSVKLH